MPHVLTANYEHFLQAKFSILFTIFFIKQIFFMSLSFPNSLFFSVLLLQQIYEILKATSSQWENSFFLRKLLFLTLKSSNSKGSYAIALKFSSKQINLISVSMTCKIMNINIDIRIFVNARHEYFWKTLKHIQN